MEESAGEVTDVKTEVKECDEKSVEETAPNLNGNKDGGQKVVTNMDTSIKSEENEDNEDKTSQGRKRKADELKEDDISLDLKQIDEKFKMKGQSDTENSSDEIKDMNHMPDDQSLGKGKRARIPNKRYSDISVNSLTPKSMPDEKPKKSTENGDLTNKDKGSTSNTSSSPIIKVLKVSNTPASTKKGKPVNMCAPAYLKPFKLGWKRELVYRATSDNPLKRSGDIYYYTPTGKKLRSMREISDNLRNTDLTLENFTFFKEPLGLDDPEKEIIRDAKARGSTPVAAKSIKISSPKATVVPAAAPEPKKVTNTASVEPSKNRNVKRTNFKVKLPIKSKSPRAKPIKKMKDEKADVGKTQHSEGNKRPLTKYGNNLNDVDNKPCRPCSIRCQGVSGLIPTLQCRVCLCLYHYECVGLTPHLNIQGYVCKNCQLDQDSLTDTSMALSSSLTSINTLKSINNQSSILPKLQRINHANDAKNSNIPLPALLPHSNVCLPKLPRPIEMYSSHQTENKSLVGSVTTWFPPSSTIQVGNNEINSENNSVRIPRPQFVEYIGSKKFLIVPKHNVLSVLPNSTFNKPEENVCTPDTTKDSTDITTNIPQTPESAKMERNLNNDHKNLEKNQTNTIPAVSSNSVSTSAEIEQEKQRENENEDILEKASESLERIAALQKTAKNSSPEPHKQPKLEITTAEGKSEINKFMDNYLQNLSYGYNTLLFVFQYLKVQDLLRAGCVCKLWRDVANHPVLWKTVRMKNSQIHSFYGLADTLKRQGTIHLDLRKMLLPAAGGDEIWPSFSDAIKKVESLKKIELCRCPAAVIEKLAETNPNMEVVNAIAIKCDCISLEPLRNLKHLKELRLKSTNGISLKSDLDALTNLKQLTHLSLTSVRDLNKLNLKVIAELQSLESLDLGECTDFPKTFGTEILIKLNNLEKLRLEKGQETCYTFEILEAVQSMEKLEQLELVNFDIKTGFNKALGACSNIKKLLIIPTYISQSATTNNMVLGGVLRLRNTLSHFVWGVTLELLRVTELFVDQCEEPDSKKEKKKPSGNGDSIPVLKPVPSIDDITNEVDVVNDPPQVEILPLPNLQKLLLQNLPTTRVKILKIPFHATWRQSITDTGN